MERKTLIYNARLVDEATDMKDAGILISGEKIEKILTGEDAAAILRAMNLDKADLSAGTDVFDARGQVVMPAFIDMHAHFRDPGLTQKEDLESGSRAAAAGGFGTLVLMPNTSPDKQGRPRPEARWRVQEAARLNGLVMCDYDVKENPTMGDPRQLWQQFVDQHLWLLDETAEGPTVMLAHVTPGRGLRLVVTADKQTGNLYDNAVRMANIIGLKSDDSCKDASRTSFVPMEEDILYINDAIFDYDDEAYEKAYGSLYRAGGSSAAGRGKRITRITGRITGDGSDDPISKGNGITQNRPQDPRISENVFLKPVTPQSVSIESFDMKTEFRQSNKSHEFIDGDDEQLEMSYMKIGSVLHNVFSTIRTSADVDRALQQLQQDGVLYDDEITADRVTALLRKRLESPRIKNWFSDRWQLFNECSILCVDSQGNMQERRPDRVMTDGKETHVVDFKFGRPRTEYLDQVREYMQLLRSMGMPNVKGWLWYVYNNKVEEVL